MTVSRAGGPLPTVSGASVNVVTCRIPFVMCRCAVRHSWAGGRDIACLRPRHPLASVGACRTWIYCL